MSTLVPESSLPQELSTPQAVDLAYPHELAGMAGDLVRGLPALVECEKDLAPFVFMSVRGRLREHDLKCLFLDGRPNPNESAGAMGPPSFVGTLISQLRNAVRGAVEKRVVVLPHLDLLTTSQGGLTSEAREVIPLLYENPELVWLGFKDPSFPLPQVIENLFPKRYSLLGIGRERLQHLITQKEARKFGKDFNPWALYKHVSGMNAARLRKMLSTLEGEDYPNNPRHAIEQVRQATLGGTLEVPNVDLEDDVGGYAKVKKRLRAEILDVLQAKDKQTDPDQIKKMESLIPRGMIFWGPPGTGKTLFAKGMATALGAAITVVSGPELKSRWVGESEENLRLIFHRARQSAPSIIVFDELDSFAAARGTYTGSGVEHSMVNQLLTEMDGFHSEELVFVVGTTNFVESLDPALLRPGRFEFHLHIPYPGRDDRRAILEIYNRSMNLDMTDTTLEYAVKRTGDFVEGAVLGTRFSGDHINALCRALARIRLREDIDRPTSPEDIERALTEWIDRPQMTKREETVVATHEAGHAICSLFCEHATPIERISIQGDAAGALGFVKYQDPTNKYVVTRGQLLDDLCILMGGREAERLLCDDLSIGSADDLRRATQIARALVEEFGMGGDDVGIVRYESDDERFPGRYRSLSPTQLERLDDSVKTLLAEACSRASDFLKENQTLVETLRDLLLEKKVIDAKTLGEITGRDIPSEEKSEQ
ncbi:AAA family ATPase [Thalassoroseus pseudoceratinae]|uniref:AAA family ATPase n=1 Tax=Thalassoroseus pseudoceratinae TaxID=2713176 RepID=UPI001422FED1|nr:AAA family ATPase [Thalassoroseus pseudoceratinae]